jgi:heme/copper-type cytochrome/quinol oxidase subunit 2
VKRKTLVVVTVTVIALLVASFFIYAQISELQNQIGALKAQNGEVQGQLSELENQLSELQLQNREQQDRLTDFTNELAKTRHLKVEITAFEWIGGFNPVGGLLIGHPVNVTVQNNDVVPLIGLRLRVSLVRENTGAEISIAGGVTLERLNAGESRVIRSEPCTSLVTSLDEAVCVVTLAADGITLDSGTYGIS